VASIGPVLGRRLLVLFAVLLGLTALVTSLAPRPTTVRGPGAVQRPSPSATPDSTTPAEPAAGASRRIEQTISADPGRPRARVRARVGDVLELTVKGDVLDGVQIEELGELEPVEPGSPARFELLLERQGELRVELVDAERLIGLVLVGAGPGGS
jgi:hypothetical protein